VIGVPTYRVYGTTVASEVPFAGVPRSTVRRPIQISIRIGARPDGAPGAVFHEWRIKGAPRQRPWLTVARLGRGYQLRFPDLADFTVSPTGDRIVCHPAPRLPSATLGHLVLDQVLPLAISRRGALALHASAVHVPRVGTIAFVGQTGTGKSTLAAALTMHGCAVVTDDCLVVDVARGCLAVPAYPGVRLWRDAVRGLGVADDGARVAHYTVKRRLLGHAASHRSSPSPIAAVFVLGRRRRRGLPTASRHLESRDRLMALAACVYVMDVEDRRQLTQMFRGLTSLVARVPVARLAVRDGRRQARDAAAEVLAIVRALPAINRK
jgi:hypothetical protein